MNYFKQRPIIKKTEYMILQFPRAAVVSELFENETYNHKDSVIILEFVRVAGCG